MTIKDEYNRALVEKARRSLLGFTTYTFGGYDVNWHHKIIGDNLDRLLVDPDFNRLMIFVPPRGGKSELVSKRLPPYALGKNPDMQIIATSYSASLSQDFSRKVQGIIDSHSYIEVFPNTRLSPSKITPIVKDLISVKRTAELFEINDHRGSYTAAGVGGAITGKGADLLLIDDPIKNREEAYSQVKRESIYNWYTSTAYTRLEKGGKVVIVLTRWHEDDLAGRLLQKAKENPMADQWHVVNFPAIREDMENKADIREIGGALWPNKYNESALSKIKNSINESDWQSMYQQRPTAATGNLFKRKWFNDRYLRLPEPSEFDDACFSWDMAFKDLATSDYVVGQVWARKGPDYYLLDEMRELMDFTTSLNAVDTLCARWPWVRAVLIEDAANGPAIISITKKKISGVIAVTPCGGKVSRANVAADFYCSGNIKIPRRERAPWSDEYIEELVSFPFGKYDDRVDSTSQAINHLSNKTKIARKVIW